MPATKIYEPLMLDYTTALTAGVDTMSGYDSTMPRRTADIVRVLTGEPVTRVLATQLHDAYAPAFSLYGALARPPRHVRRQSIAARPPTAFLRSMGRGAASPRSPRPLPRP